MSASTNSLVTKAKRFALPIGAAAALMVSIPFISTHTGVHAASFAGAAPMDDNSVSSLVALDNAVEAVAARVTPAVVNVSVTAKTTPGQDGDDDGGQAQDQGQGGLQNIPPQLRQFFGNGFGGGMQQQQPQIEHGIGSGIIVTPDGYIVTNNHVVNNATQIRVTLNDRRVLTAKLVGADKLNDIAVIKIDAKNLPVIAWGDSTKLHPGQTVLAFGNPFGNFPFTVTRGIISALDRPNMSDDRRKPGAFIQTDAAINPGNSGGPLVDSHGELIGINTFIIAGNGGAFAGAGFAIPSQIVKATADELIRNGVVHHGYLGISMNDVTPDNASFFNLPDAKGAIVSQVSPNSPASAAGLKNGDVLRELDGKTILNGGALQVAVSEVAPGTNITVGILRDGKPENIHIKVGEFHNNAEVASNSDGSAQKGAKLGVSVDNITPDVRQQLNLPDNINGAAIASVRPASPAEDAGLSPGDVILEVNRHPVQDADKFVSAVHAAPAGKDILLLVWSRGGTTYRVVHPAAGTQGSDTGL
jgi:serine protease Do